MILGNELEAQVYEAEHIEQVMAEIRSSFPRYFDAFSSELLELRFDKAVRRYEKEQARYRAYMDLDALAEFAVDPGAFKSETAKHCPIIQHCLNSQDKVMNGYKEAFGRATGRSLLPPVRHIAQFGRDYSLAFKDNQHEATTSPSDLGLDPLNAPQYGLNSVIGYGIQSAMLYGQYPREFAHRSQNAVWGLYFLSGRQAFGLEDGSEFMMVQPQRGTCEQNYFYPAQLFGFYALKVYLLLKDACARVDMTLRNRYRYIYFSEFCDHVADTHRADINVFKRSSSYVESQPWF